MHNLYMILAIVAGAGIAVQVMVNAELRSATGSTVWAAIFQFMVGLAALAATALLLRDPFPANSLPRSPWWIWTGGLFGAAYILLSIVLAPRLGAALLLASVIVGQLAASVLIDHHGWLGAPVHRFSLGRGVGALLLVIGIVLIRWK
jgi:transporter family-2 protein